jgi:CRP/FNR family cyclic AMP-dependent transcriptional regulator
MTDAVKESLDEETTEWFLSNCHVRRLPPRKTVIHAGAVPDSLYFLVEGSVSVLIEDEDGNEVVLAYLHPGDFFGEMGLFQAEATRSAWVRSRSTCRIAEIGYARFRALCHDRPELLFALGRQLAHRLQRTTRRVGNLIFLDVTGRVAGTLLELCREPDALTHPDGLQIELSRQELARIAGCSREMAGRVLKSLEEQGLVTVSGKKIVVIGARVEGDTDELQSLSQ